MAKAKTTVNIFDRVSEEANMVFKAKALLSISENYRKQLKEMISIKAEDFKNVNKYTENDFGNGTVLCVLPPYTAYMADKNAVVDYLKEHGLYEKAVAEDMVNIYRKFSSRVTFGKNYKEYINNEAAKKLPSDDIELPELCLMYIAARDDVDFNKATFSNCMDRLTAAAVGGDDITSYSVRNADDDKVSFLTQNITEIDVPKLKTIIPEEDHKMFSMIERQIKEPVITIWDAEELKKNKEYYVKKNNQEEPRPEYYAEL